MTETVGFIRTLQRAGDGGSPVQVRDIEDWTDDNLSGKKLAEYEDIKKCADAFAKIVGNNINTK